jgi:hypothetical protein
VSARGCLGAARPLSLAALDAAISETIGKSVRADRLARDDRVYRWIIRRAEREGDWFRTTYAEAAKGAGYDVDPLTCRAARKRAKQRRVSTIRRALASLQAAGVIDFRGVLKTNGQWRCLEIRIREGGRGTAPCGRSRRSPRRRPGCRVSFSPQFAQKSGYSPAVEPSVLTAEKRVPSPACARGGPNRQQQAPRTRVTNRSELRGDDWPLSAFELRQQQLVELCDVFEASFARPARFSFTGNGERLSRILARFDRFSGRGWQSGAGRREAAAIIAAVGEDARWNVKAAEKIGSLAYFLPILDEASKDRRRWWKRHVAPLWDQPDREELPDV